ncbi:aldehyde dehydrogenase family protein [Streptomyces sp. NPDC088353]|uniref:aldehyde dehydrogenase family protein n=1 Tax=Streptomyces sp. NPDC088353 TaxID=3365855 RepID=UPI0037FD984D
MAQSQHLRRNCIDGRWDPAESGQTRENINPADVTDRIGEFAESGGVDVDRAVDAATAASPGWRGLGPVKRAAFLARAGTLLTERAEAPFHG